MEFNNNILIIIFLFFSNNNFQFSAKYNKFSKIIILAQIRYIRTQILIKYLIRRMQILTINNSNTITVTTVLV